MLKNLLKEVISLVAGKQAEEIIDILDTKKYISEFVIAKKLNLTINQARNILYKISDHGLVSSIRKKDKKKGWYTYFWKIEVLKSLEFLRENLHNKVGNIEHQVKSRETKRFYACQRCHIELTEENALVNNFTCNECGSLLVLKDNSKMVKDLRKNKERLERDLRTVDGEISREKEEEEKKRAKEMKKEEAKAKRKKRQKKTRSSLARSKKKTKSKPGKIKKSLIKKRKDKKKKSGKKSHGKKRR